jgi:oligopeptide/dipeptide ABC transporter ATP-binding protein
MTDPVLIMEQVSVALPRPRPTPVLEDVSLSIASGELLALVGESGSGKTIAALSIPRLLPKGARLRGQILLCGEPLTGLDEPAMRRRRGARIGMVFQDPLASLNPSMRIGDQIAEPIRLHTGAGRQSAWAQAERLLDEVGIPQHAARARQYPHQFSGGMRQRAMIALALAGSPALLIADEPTTGLDADLKIQILDLLARLRRERQMAVLLVSHDLALVRRHADSVHVLYAGRTMERGNASALFVSARHPYTLALLRAAPVAGQAPVAIPGVLPEPEARPPGCGFAPRCPIAAPECALIAPALADGPTQAACLYPLTHMAPYGGAGHQAERARIGAKLLQVEAVAVRYRTGLFGAATVHTAIEAATLSLAEGECLALVGPSGSGKTSLGRAILHMLPYEGRITLRGMELGAFRQSQARGAAPPGRGVPGSVRLAQPDDDRRRQHRRSAAPGRRAARGRAPHPRRRAAGQCRPA